MRFLSGEPRSRLDSQNAESGHGRRRRALVGATTTAVVGAMALFVASALGVLAGSPSQFESNDGNMLVDTIGHTDWQSVTSSSSYNHLTDLFNVTTDDSFTPGQKQDTVCPDISGHKNPAKDDFTDVARYTEVDANGHTFLYGATIRFAANGDASENIELKHGGNGICTGTSDLLQRVAGDRMIAIDYTGGGTSAKFNVLTWVTSGACFVKTDTAPCWGATVETLAANAAEGEVSQSPIAAGDNTINGKALVAGQFAEFGIDLSAGTNPIVPPGSCSPFAQTIWESRSSGSSFVSSTKDIVRDDVGFSNCGEIKIVKNTNPRNLDKDFSYTSNLPANSNAGGNCSGIAATGAFCLNDKSTATNNVDAKNLQAGNYTITEGADSTDFAFASLTCSQTDHVTIVGRQVSIALAPNDNITCTYVNDQQTGAIKITKTSSKTAATPLTGAHFQICTNNGPYNANNTCTPAKTGSGDVVTAGTSGSVCVDGLPFGSYYVQETSPPNGYKLDSDAVTTIPVDNGAKCSDTTFVGETKTYTDTPLTDVTVHVESQASGGTASAVRCVDANSANIGNSPRPAGVDLGDITTYADPVTLTANGLSPGTYTCTVIIDP